jgi:hypothetical protein
VWIEQSIGVERDRPIIEVRTKTKNDSKCAQRSGM